MYIPKNKSVSLVFQIFVRKNSGDDSLREFQPDPEFRRVVFAEEINEPSKISKEPLLPPPLFKAPTTDTTRLGMSSISNMLIANELANNNDMSETS